MKQKSIAGLLSFILLILFTSCSSKEVSRLSCDLGEEPEILDPQYATDAGALTIIQNIFEGLMTVDQNGEITNGAAESYQVSDDGLFYQFTLKSGLTWSDGTPLTAYDFEFAFRRLMDPDDKSPYASDFYCIQNAVEVSQGTMKKESLGVHAISDTQLEFTLEYVNPSFLELLTTAPAMPCNQKFYEETEGEYGLELRSIITNGPFCITTWQHHQSIRLSVNDTYWDANSVLLDQIDLAMGHSATDMQDENGQWKRFQEGKTDLYWSDQMLELSDVDSDLYEIMYTQNMVWGLLFNTQSVYGQSGNLRRTIAYGIDRSRLENVLPDELSVTSYLIPSDLMLGGENYRKNATVSPLEFDAIAAEDCMVAALNELDLSSLRTIDVIMPKTDGLDHDEYFSYLSQGLQKEVGVYFSVSALEEKEYRERIQSGDFTVALVCIQSEGQNADSVFEQFLPQSEKNYASYENPNYVDTIEHTLDGEDISQITALFSKAEQQLLQDAVFIPLYEQPSTLLWNSSVSGVVVNPWNGFLNFRYIKLS
jgi:oligopeptide transport system substrate-binding protein